MAHSFIDCSDFLINQGFFLYPPYAARMGTRSRTIIKICLTTERSIRQLRFIWRWNSPSHPAKPAKYPLL